MRSRCKNKDGPSHLFPLRTWRETSLILDHPSPPPSFLRKTKRTKSPSAMSHPTSRAPPPSANKSARACSSGSPGLPSYLFPALGKAKHSSSHLDRGGSSPREPRSTMASNSALATLPPPRKTFGEGWLEEGWRRAPSRTLQRSKLTHADARVPLKLTEDIQHTTERTSDLVRRRVYARVESIACACAKGGESDSR